MELCSTCGKLPSQGNRDYEVDDGGGHYDRMEDNCPGPVHKQADIAPAMYEAIGKALDFFDERARDGKWIDPEARLIWATLYNSRLRNGQDIDLTPIPPPEKTPDPPSLEDRVRDLEIECERLRNQMPQPGRDH